MRVSISSCSNDVVSVYKCILTSIAFPETDKLWHFPFGSICVAVEDRVYVCKQ